MMDKKCYLWIFNNISKYSFDADTISIKESIGRLLITEDSINSPEIIKKMESYYEQLISNFYNNVIGFQNGLADKKITASELDCYFIGTSDGMVPIGYYRMVRPAEAVAIIQKYLDICKNNISTEKNKNRLEAEIAANKEVMSRIAEVQSELLNTAIEKWRIEELEKIEKNPSAYIKSGSNV